MNAISNTFYNVIHALATIAYGNPYVATAAAAISVAGLALSHFRKKKIHTPLECYEKISDLLDKVYFRDLDKHPSCAKKICNLLTQPVLYMSNQSGRQEKTTLFKILGYGGAKKAVEIPNNQALILPNMDADPITQVADRWERMVDEEILISNLYASTGLLHGQLEKVRVSVNPDADSIPAYKTASFQSLAKNGCYIIDTNNRKHSIWNGSLFNNEKERFDEKSWDLVTKPLLEDIKKIVCNNLPYQGDSLNMAVMKNQRGCVVRYFGFDFSSKYHPVRGNGTDSSEPNYQEIRRLFHIMLSYLLEKEFSILADGPSTSKEYQLADNFRKSLQRRYTVDFISEM